MKKSLVFIAVDHKTIGDIEMEFDGGATLSGAALVLDCVFVNVRTAKTETLTLVVPTATGINLVRHLLTEEQMDAVMSA